MSEVWNCIDTANLGAPSFQHAWEEKWDTEDAKARKHDSDLDQMYTGSSVGSTGTGESSGGSIAEREDEEVVEKGPVDGDLIYVPLMFIDTDMYVSAPPEMTYPK